MHGMMTYFIRRVLLIPVTFVCITLLVYTVTRLVPGGPIEQAKRALQSQDGGGGEAGGGSGGGGAGEEDQALPEEAVKELEKYYNLNDSIPVGYFKWLCGYYSYVVDPDLLLTEEHWSKATTKGGVQITRTDKGLVVTNTSLDPAVITIPFSTAKDLAIDVKAAVKTGALTFVFLHLPTPEGENPLKNRSFVLDDFKSLGGPKGVAHYHIDVFLASQRFKVVDHEKMLIDEGTVKKDKPEDSEEKEEKSDDPIPGGLEIRVAPGTRAVLYQLDLTRDEDFSIFTSFGSLISSWTSGGRKGEYWHHGIITGGFGTSYIRGDPVLDVVLSKMPISMYFGLIGFFSTWIICIPLGTFKAIKHRSMFDTGSSVAVFAGYSIPGFVACLILLVLFGGGSFWDLLPLGGFQSENFDDLSFFGQVLDRIEHLIIPLTGYLIVGFATMTILMKNSLLDNFGADYVRTAFAKGLSEKRVIFVHAMRNSLIPVTAGLGHALGLLFAGSFLIEKTCNIPGMGLLGYNSIIQKDYPIILGVLVIGVLIRLSGNIFSDIIWATIDPRIRFG